MAIETKDLFGGAFIQPPELRLVCRFCVRLTPKQRETFFDRSSGLGVSPSESLRNLIVEFIDSSPPAKAQQTRKRVEVKHENNRKSTRA